MKIYRYTYRIDQTDRYLALVTISDVIIHELLGIFPNLFCLALWGPRGEDWVGRQLFNKYVSFHFTFEWGWLYEGNFSISYMERKLS